MNLSGSSSFILVWRTKHSFHEGGILQSSSLFFFSSMETVFSPVSGPHTTIILLPWLQPFCLKASFCLVLFHPRFCLLLLVHRDNPCSEDDGWLTRVIEKRSKFRREKPSTHHLTAHMPAPSCLTSTRPCLVKTEEDFEGTPKNVSLLRLKSDL